MQKEYKITVLYHDFILFFYKNRLHFVDLLIFLSNVPKNAILLQSH